MNTTTQALFTKVKARILLAVLAGCISLGALATRASAFWPFSGVTQRSYTLHGYLDRAPAGVAVLDRVDMTTLDGRSRVLVITQYTKPGDVPPVDGRISREPVRNFTLRGSAADVNRMIGGPANGKVEGSFVVYEGSPAALMITSLAQPSAG